MIRSTITMLMLVLRFYCFNFVFFFNFHEVADNVPWKKTAVIALKLNL